jgi:hypothetical protein
VARWVTQCGATQCLLFGAKRTCNRTRHSVANDPERHFATVKCRSAKDLFDHYVGAAERVDVTCPCRAADLLLLVKPEPIWITLKSKQWFASPILCATPCTSRTGLATAGRFSLMRGPAVLMSRPRRQKGKATQLAQPGRAAPMRSGRQLSGEDRSLQPMVGAAVDDSSLPFGGQFCCVAHQRIFSHDLGISHRAVRLRPRSRRRAQLATVSRQRCAKQLREWRRDTAPPPLRAHRHTG